ncbi:hypothetical protein AB0M46_31820 [Dactylosporangium sp. NPDC051485]
MAACGRFKEVPARHVPDIGAYSDIKDPVVDLVVAAALAGERPPDVR